MNEQLIDELTRAWRVCEILRTENQELRAALRKIRDLNNEDDPGRG